MKRYLITILLIIVIGAISLVVLSHTTVGKNLRAVSPTIQGNRSALSSRVVGKLNLKASEAKYFARKNNFNTNFCFLIDMSLASNKRRFFIYDLQKDSVVNSALVAHGNCNQYWLEGRRYNNAIGSGCTSLGKYKVGYSYTGRFGLAFKLYGLEKTNSNAFARYVVLHSYQDVPETEVEDEICQSNGCPMVSPGFLKNLEPLIRSSKKPILLWIYE